MGRAYRRAGAASPAEEKSSRIRASKELGRCPQGAAAVAHIPLGAHKPEADGPLSGRKTMKLKIKLLKGGDFEMEIDAAKKVRHRTPLARLSVSSCCSLLPGH